MLTENREGKEAEMETEKGIITDHQRRMRMRSLRPVPSSAAGSWGIRQAAVSFRGSTDSTDRNREHKCPLWNPPATPAAGAVSCDPSSKWGSCRPPAPRRLAGRTPRKSLSPLKSINTQKIIKIYRLPGSIEAWSTVAPSSDQLSHYELTLGNALKVTFTFEIDKFVMIIMLMYRLSGSIEAWSTVAPSSGHHWHEFTDFYNLVQIGWNVWKKIAYRQTDWQIW